MSYSEYILSMNRSKIIIKIDDLFMSVSHGLPSPTPLLSRGIHQRQNEVRNNRARHTLLPPTPLLPRHSLQRQNGV